MRDTILVGYFLDHLNLRYKVSSANIHLLSLLTLQTIRGRGHLRGKGQKGWEKALNVSADHFEQKKTHNSFMILTSA